MTAASPSPARFRFAVPASRRCLGVLLVLLLLALAPSCARRKARPRPAFAPPAGYIEKGIASWYGVPYHGRRAASGEVFDMEQLTAAHRTFAFGTWVRVHNLDNGKRIDVRINDRGPFIRGRVIDISRAAARSIAMIGPGLARVRIEVIAPPPLPPPHPAISVSALFAVQVGAFRERENAERMRASMETRFGKARLSRRDGSDVPWRVLVGEENSEESAAALAALLSTEVGEAFVVRLDGVHPQVVENTR